MYLLYAFKNRWDYTLKIVLQRAYRDLILPVSFHVSTYRSTSIKKNETLHGYALLWVCLNLDNE